MGKVLVSVVIPCLNAGQQITRLLEQLSQQTLPRDEYEIIVIDDGSTDDTRQQIAQFADVTLLQQDRAGPGTARNLGTEKSSGEYVLYVDSDLEVAEDLLEAHLAYHQSHPEVAATGGCVVPPKKPPLFSWVLVDHLSSWFNAHPAVVYHHSPEYLPSLNFCIKRQLVAVENGIQWADGLQHTGEDVIYCHALRAKNLTLHFVPAATVKHRDRTTMRGYLLHVYRWGYHAPFVRGKLKDLKYGFLFPQNKFLLAFTVPLIICGYTYLIWKSWLRVSPFAATLCLPQIILGRFAYAWGVIRGTQARNRSR